MVMYYCFSVCWLCTFTVVGYFTFSWLVVTYKGNSSVVISQIPKTGKITVLSNLPQFPPKISFIWKKFWSDDYILMKGNKKNNTTNPFLNFLELLKFKNLTFFVLAHQRLLTWQFFYITLKIGISWKKGESFVWFG